MYRSHQLDACKCGVPRNHGENLHHHVSNAFGSYKMAISVKKKVLGGACKMVLYGWLKLNAPFVMVNIKGSRERRKSKLRIRKAIQVSSNHAAFKNYFGFFHRIFCKKHIRVSETVSLGGKKLLFRWWKFRKRLEFIRINRNFSELLGHCYNLALNQQCFSVEDSLEASSLL